MKITAKSNQKELLSAGKYIAKITKVSMTTAKPNDAYSDVTPQLEVRFETPKGFITHWYNLKGFKKDAGGNFEINPKTRERIEDEKNTSDALDILSRLALHAGYPENTEIDMEDLIDMEVGIMVKEEGTSTKVAYTLYPSKVEASAEIEG